MQEKGITRPCMSITTCIIYFIQAQVLVYLGELEATERKYKQYEDAYGTQKKQNEDLVRKINIMGKDF